LEAIIFHEYGNFLWLALIILLIGIVLGRLWAFFIHQSAKAKSRRQIYGLANYIQGLNYLIYGEKDLAILQLGEAARKNSENVEIFLTLGNLLRKKGQVERAIQIHQGLLHRSDLEPAERTQVLYCLGMDFKSAGFIDRSLKIFEDLLNREPDNTLVLQQMEMLQEELQNWQRAYELQQKIIKKTKSEYNSVLGFLQNELGKAAWEKGDIKSAIKYFNNAISLYEYTYPAYLNLGDIYFEQGNHKDAVDIWEKIATISPNKANLVFDRLKEAYKALNQEEKFNRFFSHLAEKNPHNWRCHYLLSRIAREEDNLPAASEALKKAITIKPDSLSLHQAFCRLLQIQNLPAEEMKQYLNLIEQHIPLSSYHICTNCRYKSTEILWKCPHCSQWNTFTEVEA
jgi:lipopolysaccharide biosynthesis regulator YciM